jgi:hypothetical protein
MASDIQAVLERRNDPKLLAERTDELARAAREFYLQAEESRRRQERIRLMWWLVCLGVLELGDLTLTLPGIFGLIEGLGLGSGKMDSSSGSLVLGFAAVG